MEEDQGKNIKVKIKSLNIRIHALTVHTLDCPGGNIRLLVA
jgi:hypothetical protein